MSDDKSFYNTFFYIIGLLAVGCVVLIILASNLTTDVAEYKPKEIVQANIQPVGNVQVAGMSSSAAAAETAPAAAEPAATPEPAAARSGETVYNTKCLACHATGAAGAPKTGDAAAWSARSAAGAETMLANAINGVGAMPPRGLCMDCSDDELQAAIDFILANSQ